MYSAGDMQMCFWVAYLSGIGIGILAYKLFTKTREEADHE